jgi:hypothetical protein
MNELERLIAAVNRPEPGCRLDDRVQTLFAQTRLRPDNPPRMNALVACGAAVCVGLLGFFVGRLSVSAPTDPLPAMASASHLRPRPENPPVATSVMKVPLGDDQLAGLFVRSAHDEGLLGSGPVTILTSASP